MGAMPHLSRGVDPGTLGPRVSYGVFARGRPYRTLEVKLPAFIPPGAEAYKRDLPDAEVHLLDAGHFALETHAEEIAALVRDFLERALPMEKPAVDRLSTSGI